MDIRKRMQFHQFMGIEAYPRNGGVDLFLDKSSPARLSGPGKSLPAKSESKPTTGRPEGIERQKTTLPATAQEIRQCTSCHLSACRRGTVAGQGKAGSALMVVGDWSHQGDDFSGNVLFGRQEDDMLWKMMAAIDLDEPRVYVTNCIKCCPGKEAKVDAAAEKSCFSYLEREIAAVRPRIICAMGDIAARILLGSSKPLVRLRGKLGSYRYQSSEPIAVMPTFHPRFLLRSPEMKKATWNDLQLIRRNLDEREG